MDVIITDHHEILDALPPATAILNPKRKDCAYPFKELAGVGVAFNLVIALRSVLRGEGFFHERALPNLKRDLDLVALGTISDVVPLTGVNRILAKYGLAELTHSTRPGILALKDAAGIVDQEVDAAAVNYRLAPRMNAAGRMEESGQVIRLLTSEDLGESGRIAARLNQLNSLRQQIEERTLAEAAAMMPPVSSAGTLTRPPTAVWRRTLSSALSGIARASTISSHASAVSRWSGFPASLSTSSVWASMSWCIAPTERRMPLSPRR